MAQELPQLVPGQVLSNKYRVDKKLGEGGFGGVYFCTDTTTNTRYALKVEGANEQIQLLKMEVYVLETLTQKGLNRHFAAIVDKGRNSQYNYIIMTLLGKSLQDLMKLAPTRHFSVSTALRIGIYCLEGLEDMHNIGYLHRDVKPGNYAMGRPEINEGRKLYVLDFGMCRKYLKEDGRQRTPRAAAGFRGTVRYAPINCHLFRELARKDDLETWFYMLVEMTTGRLPWANINDINDCGKYKQRVREDAYIKELVGGCPRMYIDLLRYIDNLRYYDKPDYNKVYDMLRTTLSAMGGKESDPYDWESGGGAPAAPSAPVQRQQKALGGGFNPAPPPFF